MAVVNIPGTDSDLQAALADVNLPTLLLTMAQLSGDDRWLSERYSPQPIVTPEGSLFPDDSGGYSPELATEIRAEALKLFAAARDARPELPPAPSIDRVREMMAFAVAEPVDRNLAAMLREEMGFENRDDQWSKPLAKALAKGDAENFSVIVVGAGMSGLCIAAKLQEAGVAYRVLEKNEAVGGTWFENSYPDCGVDTPNHFYSYSFHRNPNWSGYFSKRDELYAYFEECADAFGVRHAIELQTTVDAMRFDAATDQWEVDVSRADGSSETLSANVVVTAVGQLNRPNLPDIDGIDDFAGPLFHSARWRHDVDLEGKRVAVIGTGCSAVQLLPKTAAKAEHVSVFQRTPHWVTPNKDYYKPVEAGIIWALNHIPFYAEWHRARMIFGFADRNWPAVVGDPDWQHQDRSISELNDGVREALSGYIRDQLGNRQDLAEACTPDFPPFGKRPVIDNNWYPTITRDNVELVTTGIRRIVPEGVETEDGQVHAVDAIITATGFKSNLFLWPMDVVGRTGTALHDLWGDYPRAYKGVTVPEYPNLFVLYGPNTNIVHGGGVIYQVECQVHYVMQCLTRMIEQRLAVMEVKADVNDAYNEKVQALSANLAWGHPGVQSWYKNSAGKVVNNSPYSLLEYWEVTHDLQQDNYVTR
ncbi:MAG TPA: NAD(P)/FAD-dependent oxidoreductase [Pseudomonadales bacterium]|nr:NAD(P)/FAD-dependent oxidoreductase [Pseudomonadales bacterium]